MIHWTLELVLASVVIALVWWGYTFANIEENEDLDEDWEKENNDDWHKGKAGFITFMYIGNSIALFGLHWKAIVWVVAQTFLTVLVFNPAINLFKDKNRKNKKGFFYLSDEGIEGKFKRSVGGKVYYLLALGVFVGGYLVVKLL